MLLLFKFVQLYKLKKQQQKFISTYSRNSCNINETIISFTCCKNLIIVIIHASKENLLPSIMMNKLKEKEEKIQKGPDNNLLETLLIFVSMIINFSISVSSFAQVLFLFFYRLDASWVFPSQLV